MNIKKKIYLIKIINTLIINDINAISDIAKKV